MHKLTLDQIEKYILDHQEFQLNEETEKNIQHSFRFLTDFSRDRIIYGINTGFGPMAQFRIENSELNQLQYNLIRSHASGAGKPLGEEYARSVVLARLNTLTQGRSGISLPVIKTLQAFLNHNVIPEIYDHGSVGASGDLVQLAHLGLNLIGEGHVRYNGVRRKTMEVLNELGIEPLKLSLRDGLGIINGTSSMTGIAAINLIYAYRLINLAISASAMINEIVESYDDSFSKELNEAKLHPGQQKVAEGMRRFLKGSRLIKKREELFNDGSALQTVKFKEKIQEYYSIRCVPQILGPVLDTMDNVRKVVENEINSTNDNPIVRPDLNHVYHGGNFHGDYISLEMDKLKIVLTKVSVLMERQLNFLMNHALNDKFPPFLNAGTLGLNFGFQGIQYTATSTTAENQALSNPVYVHSIPSNNDNQDVVSMGTNSAMMAQKVLDNTFIVLAIHFMAICQSIDLLDEEKRERMSKKSMGVYKMIRSRIGFLDADHSQSENILYLCKALKKSILKL